MATYLKTLVTKPNVLLLILLLYNGVTNSGPQRELSQGVAQAKPTPIGETRARLLMALNNACDVWTYVTFGIKYCGASHKFAASVLDMFKGKPSELDAVAFTYAFIGAKELPDSFRWRSVAKGVDTAYSNYITAKLGPGPTLVGGVNGTTCFTNAVRSFKAIRASRKKKAPRSGNGSFDRLLASTVGDWELSRQFIVSRMQSLDIGWNVFIRCYVANGRKHRTIHLPVCVVYATAVLQLFSDVVKALGLEDTRHKETVAATLFLMERSSPSAPLPPFMGTVEDERVLARHDILVEADTASTILKWIRSNVDAQRARCRFLATIGEHAGKADVDVVLAHAPAHLQGRRAPTLGTFSPVKLYLHVKGKVKNRSRRLHPGSQRRRHGHADALGGEVLRDPRLPLR